MVKRVFYFIVTACLFVLAAVLGLSFPSTTPPVTIVSIKAMEPSVIPGDKIDIEYLLLKQFDCDSKADRIVVDSNGTRHNILEHFAHDAIPRGEGLYLRTVTINLPKQIAYGSAYYQANIYYSCNFIQTVFSPILVEGPRVFFDIVPALPYDEFKSKS